MSISSTLDRLHFWAKQNIWLWLFSVFCRLSLALGFIPAAIVKLIDERFASGLHANHPMGHYLEALHRTGYYYTFIGVAQLAAAIFLLIPRTVPLGAFIYFPIILNITVLTYATRFDGSIFTAPLMTLANLYLLGWNYEKWKYVLPLSRPDDELTARKSLESDIRTPDGSEGNNVFFSNKIRSIHARFRSFLKRLLTDKFPGLFFAGVFAAIILFVLIVPRLFAVKPRNTFEKCMLQFKDTGRTRAGESFCACIHRDGDPLGKCLGDYDAATDDVGAP